MNDSPSLRVHEWLAILIAIGIIGSIALITSLNQDNTKTQTELLGKIDKEGFDVLVRGCVEHPGVYHFNTQVKMGDILAMAGVTPESDLRRYRQDAIITKGRTISVPTRAMITIYVKGAVKLETSFRIPKGTQLQDLLSIVALEEDADIEFLQSRRPLRPDEVIEIPSIDVTPERGRKKATNLGI